MKIGCAKEIKNNEFRVGLTPDNAKAYIAAGHEVLIEKGAGLGSGFTDKEYAMVGAQVLDQAADVWNQCDMMAKAASRSISVSPALIPIIFRLWP